MCEESATARSSALGWAEWSYMRGVLVGCSEDDFGLIRPTHERSDENEQFGREAGSRSMFGQLVLISGREV
jgi:hypothetical protein